MSTSENADRTPSLAQSLQKKRLAGAGSDQLAQSAGAESAAPAPPTTTPAEVQGQTCLHCGEGSPADANWCEACGGDLDAPLVTPKHPCVSCSAAALEVTDDGWCQICGTKQPAPEDHVVADHGWFAMVSDRGRVHRTNEDAGAVAARSTGVALVICDGVSSTDESQHAARAAVQVIADLIAGAPPDRLDAVFISAAQAAQTAIVDLDSMGTGEPPSCTMVAAAADVNGAIADLTIGWLGDSRAYWVANNTATQLTRDHSWAMEQTELGELDADAIEADSRAHSITRWLGADSHDVTPELRSVQVQLPGLLVLCSDGLWNYAPADADMHAIVSAADTEATLETPLAKAERLVAFANAQGGHDNITVAIATLNPLTEGAPNG